MTRSAGGLISRVSNLIAGAAQPWNPGPPYPSIFELAAHRSDLERKGGVYLLWHLGVRPRWLRAGHSIDLAGSFAAQAELKAIASCRSNGGVFVAWSAVQRDRRAGVVRYLAQRLEPAFQALAVPSEDALHETAPIVFPLPPGTQDLTSGAP
jgi:hypothetical protein